MCQRSETPAATARDSWYQTQSRDGGATWDYSWYMDWTRVG
ncbi:MAG: hypothetical protein ABL874_02975 [Sphingopyxis sp.]